MSDAFLGEIRIFSCNFAPKGWAPCNGQFLPINQNQALFSLLGTQYGGNGQTTFALPNLKGTAPVHPDLILQGESSGVEQVTISAAQLPGHGHLRATTNQATLASPVGNVLANAARRGPATFAPPSSPVVLMGSTLTGGGQSHTNMQPFLTLMFAISLIGIFPPR